MDGREIDVDGWRGMAGHNWGAQHAERWIWLHGLTEDGDWLDAAIGRVKLGPVTTPWVANGALSVAGDRHAAAPGEGDRVPGPVHVRAVRAAAWRCAERSRRRAERFVGWVYADPDGSEHHAVNCSIADMRLTREARAGARRSELVVPHAAAYELGMREHDHGIADPAVSGRVRACAEIVDRAAARGGLASGPPNPSHWHVMAARGGDRRRPPTCVPGSPDSYAPCAATFARSVSEPRFESTLELAEEVVRHTRPADRRRLARATRWPVFVFVFARPLARRDDAPPDRGRSWRG